MKFLRKILTLSLAAALALSAVPALAAGAGLDNFCYSRDYPAGLFTDVGEDRWFAGSVAAAYELGLVSGASEITFEPDGSVTLAEALALACRLHSIYHTGAAGFTQGAPWYQVYVDYAVENGIIAVGAYRDYNAAATRSQFAAILAAALPAEALAAVNTVEDGAIPDVPQGSESYDAVYRLYRAGVLTGNDAAGTFTPGSAIARSEMAALVTRMADPDLRKAITLTLPEESSEPQIPSEGSGGNSGSEGSNINVPDHEEDEGDLVWVPLNGGTKYHSYAGCSNMENPMQVTIETAEANGYTPCKRCF